LRRGGLVEIITNAKLRLFRVPDLLSAAFVSDARSAIHVSLSMNWTR